MASKKSVQFKLAYKELSRDLRARSTNAECVFWERVRGKRLSGYKFRRQHRIATFIVDFYCHRARLIVEVDGSVHDTPAQQLKDTHRDLTLNGMGYHVVRYKNQEVFQQLEHVLETLESLLDRLSTTDP